MKYLRYLVPAVIGLVLSLFFFYKNPDPCKVGKCEVKKVHYSFTLKNTTNRVITDATLKTFAPLERTSLQQRRLIDSNSQYQLESDDRGNQFLSYRIDALPPYATRVISVKADLMVANSPYEFKNREVNDYLKPEPFIESNHFEIIRLARSLKKKKADQTAHMIKQWVKDHIKYQGYTKNPRGALYALNHKKGDCSEMMYLMAALLRANQIPARCVGGFVMAESVKVTPNDYHNWVEFYHNKRWYVIDPLNDVFMSHTKDYIGFKILSPSDDNRANAFQRYSVNNDDIKVKMSL